MNRLVQVAQIDGNTLKADLAGMAMNYDRFKIIANHLQILDVNDLNL